MNTPETYAILLAVVVLWPSRARNADISDYAEHGGRTVGL